MGGVVSYWWNPGALNCKIGERERALVKLNNKAQAQSVYSIIGLSCTLSANGGGQGGKTGLYLIPHRTRMPKQ